jgi:Na+/H+ antiporter
MDHAEPILVILVLFIVGAALSYLARWLRIATPILLLIGGVVVGYVLDATLEFEPIELEPDLVFLLFLPPILFAGAYFTPIRDFRANRRAIGLLAIGLVLFTTAVVGVVASAVIPGMTLAVGLTLGAIVAPPDAVAATAIFQRLGVPRKVVTILEGESLINDASALIAYRVASGVALGVITFSVVDATVQFVVLAVGGVAIGVICGAIVTRALFRTADPVLEIVVSLLAPIVSYVVAEEVGVSGVLATVTAGLITGRKAARAFSPDARLLGLGAWQVVIWTINTFVFMLIGLQLPTIMDGLSDYPATDLLWYAAVISLTVIVTRFVWVFPSIYLPRWLSAKIRMQGPAPSPASVVIVSWAGMRGVVSLAAALALVPDFPQRELILYLTFCVILATLVGQGLTLPGLIRSLGVTASNDGAEAELAHARLAASEAALVKLEDLRADYPDHLPLIDQLREDIEHEAGHHVLADGTTPNEAEQEALDHRAIRNALLVAQREAVIRLRDDAIINDETLRSIERDLDLEALRGGA